MAFISQDEKKAIAPAVKKLLSKYGLKGSLSVDHHSTLVLTIASGKIDFIENFNRVAGARAEYRGPNSFSPATDHLDVNTYWFYEHFDGKAKDFLAEVIPAMKGPGWFDKSDIMTDYFHVKHYVDVKVGRWNKPYIHTA
jgi:hypothetical protein